MRKYRSKRKSREDTVMGRSFLLDASFPVLLTSHFQTCAFSPVHSGRVITPYEKRLRITEWTTE